MVAVTVLAGLVGAGSVAQAAPPARTAAVQQAPLIDDVQPGDGQVEVSVDLGDTAGAQVSQVTVAAFAVDDQGNPTGSAVATGTAPNADPANPVLVTVSGLTNDVDYAFQATETTADGTTSAPSEPYWGGPQTPEVPVAPTLDSVFGRDQSLQVTWNPAENGGSPVTGYTVTATPTQAGAPSGTATTSGSQTSATISGLANGTPYTVSVTAQNRIGASLAGQSDDQTVGADANGASTPQPPYPSGPPVGISAGPPPANVDGSAPDPSALLVSWNPPVDDGGSAILGYTVTATATGQPAVSTTAAAGATQQLLTGLAPDVEYSVTVSTVNPAGTATRHAAAASDPVTAAAGPTLDAQTVVLSAASVNSISAVTDTTVVFTNPPAQVQNLVHRDIIAVGANTNPRTADGGLLRAVDTISQAGNQWTVTTSNATVDEAFPHLDVTASEDKKTENQATLKVLDPRFRASLNQAIGGKFSIDLGEKVNNDPKMKDKLKGASVTARLDAELSITPDWKAQAGFKRDPRTPWWKFWDLYTFTYDFKAAATLKAAVRGEIGVAYKAETQKKPLLTIESKSCVWVYVVAFCPKLTVSSQIGVDGSIKFTFQKSYERYMGGEVGRRADTSTYKNDLTRNPVQTPFTYSLSASAKVTISLPIDLEILVYKVAGPQLTITPSLILTADTAANPWLKLDFGLSVSVYFVIDIKLKRWQFGGTVYSGTFPLWNAGGAFPGPTLSGGTSAATTTAARAPARPLSRRLVARDATPVRYTVTWPANCDPGENVTWSMQDGSLGSVDATGLYTPPSPLPATDFTDLVNASTAGSANCPATTVSAAIHYGTSVPGAPTNAAISPDGSTVGWTAPADDGGSPITSYVVTALGDPSDPASSDYVLGTVAGNATSLQIPTDRVPGIEYDHAQVMVTAVSDRGQGPDSDPSPPAPGADPGVVLTAASDGLLTSTVTLNPAVFNVGPQDTSSTAIAISYPAGFGNPSVPGNCTVDTTARVITCELGPLTAGTGVQTPIQLTAGLLTIGSQLDFTATRTESTPYAIDPNDGTDTASCTALTSLLISC